MIAVCENAIKIVSADLQEVHILGPGDWVELSLDVSASCEDAHGNF